MYIMSGSARYYGGLMIRLLLASLLPIRGSKDKAIWSVRGNYLVSPDGDRMTPERIVVVVDLGDFRDRHFGRSAG